MARYEVYWEVADDGMSMGHVVGLPGCMVRAASREAAERQLGPAIDEYHAWLRKHGEPALAEDEPIEVVAAGEVTGEGPFDPGDRAALFPPDVEPITVEEMEGYYRRMEYNRSDLLALVGDPVADLLDWRPDPESYNLRRVLRHIGNGDQWYVSRIVPPETLPPEWEDDEDLPVFEFLAMSRRTTIARLQQLTARERAEVFHPTVGTTHPEEGWTARKVLRRSLEHEREHIAQARQILAAYRRWLLARLAGERAGLLAGLLGLDERTMTETPVGDEWTVKDLLAHAAAWDRWEEQMMRSMVAGEEPDWIAEEDLDATNAAFVEAWRHRSLEAVLAELRAARADWLSWLRSLTEELFYQPRSHAGEDLSFYTGQLRIQWEHDAEHAAEIAVWRKSEVPTGASGVKAVLLAALQAARDELLACSALVLVETRDSRRVCGEWTLKDVLGHVADWEWFGVEGLRMMAGGRAPEVELVEDFDAWNWLHVNARREQPWEVVCDDLHGARQALLDVAEAMSEAQLARWFPFPWGGGGTAYEWLAIFAGHDREHARDLYLEEGD